MKTKAVFSNLSLSPASDTSMSSAMKSSGSIGKRPLFRLVCCPHGRACGGYHPCLYRRACWSCAQHLCEQLKLLYVAVPLIPPPAPSLFICCLRCCLTLVFLQLQSPLSLVLSLLLSSSKWPCETRLGGPYPFLTLRLLPELTEQQEMCSSFQPCSLLVLGSPVWLFSPRSLFFSHSPLCELFNLPLRNVAVRADECQG